MGTTVEVDSDFGYVLLVALAMFLLQFIGQTIPVAMARRATKIKPPVLYPRDSLVKSLKLSEDQVSDYLCAQRVHQNSVELNSVFLPLFLTSGLFEPRNTAIAGAVVLAGRIVYTIGYLRRAKYRMFGSFYYFGILYILYSIGSRGFELVQQTNESSSSWR